MYLSPRYTPTAWTPRRFLKRRFGPSPAHTTTFKSYAGHTVPSSLFPSLHSPKKVRGLDVPIDTPNPRLLALAFAFSPLLSLPTLDSHQVYSKELKADT